MDLLRLLKNEARQFLKHKMLNTASDLGREVHRKGFAVVNDFLGSEDASALRDIIDQAESQKPGSLWTDGADTRLFGADRFSQVATKFFFNPRFLDVFGWAGQESLVKGFPMLGKIRAHSGNKGSGGGWHRDAALCDQYKALAYLSDVTAENGPFQYIEGSHRSSTLIRDCLRFKFKHDQYRFSEEEVNRIISAEPQRLRTFTAEQGTVLLVNTRGIHRGMPIAKGVRYAITNYYFFNHNPPPHLLETLKYRES